MLGSPRRLEVTRTIDLNTGKPIVLVPVRSLGSDRGIVRVDADAWAILRKLGYSDQLRGSRPMPDGRPKIETAYGAGADGLSGERKALSLARVLCACRPGEGVVHADGDVLNMAMDNLRVVAGSYQSDTLRVGRWKASGYNAYVGRITPEQCGAVSDPDQLRAIFAAVRDVSDGGGGRGLRSIVEVDAVVRGLRKRQGEARKAA